MYPGREEHKQAKVRPSRTCNAFCTRMHRTFGGMPRAPGHSGKCMPHTPGDNAHHVTGIRRRCGSCSLFHGGWNWLVVRWTTASTCDNLQVRKLTFAWLLICFSFSKLPPSLLAISPAHFFFSGVIHWRVRLGSILTLVCIQPG